MEKIKNTIKAHKKDAVVVAVTAASSIALYVVAQKRFGSGGDVISTQAGRMPEAVAKAISTAKTADKAKNTVKSSAKAAKPAAA